MPSQLKRGKNYTVKFQVIIKNGTMPNNFELRYLTSDPSMQLSDLKISKITTTKLGNNGGEQKIYEYQFKVKALLWNINKPSIKFFGNTLFGTGNKGFKELVLVNNDFKV